MKALLSALISVPGLGGLAGALLLGLLIWFFAPVLLGLQSTAVLVLLALLPVLIWLLVFVFLVRRAQKRDAALVAGATQVDEKAVKAGAAAAAANEEEQAVAARLAQALAAMKAAGAGKGGYLYERPWYVLIGPPGGGKTTAIRNSGLSFPLAEGRVSGVGGTRNCDWWIAEQAVLIDTAGRYTTQDSDAAADKAGWERFLALLRQQRPQQPLNGVIVAFGADLLSQLNAAGREEHAQNVRRRVRELEQKLGQRLPVYLLVSKADLIVGFTEFFDDLDREARQQVWGMTFSAEVQAEGSAGAFDAEYKSLLQRLQDRLLERLQAERGAEQRASIAGFPSQFASLQGPLGDFVKSAFGGSKLDPAPFLRGLYFTSGTQEGTPIDRLTGALSRTFGLDPRRPAAVMGQKGRSYFLGRLLLDVVFNEARLAAKDKGQERRAGKLRLAAIGGSALLLLLGLGWGGYAWHLESGRLQQVQVATEAAQTQAQALPLQTVNANDDLASLLPLLDKARALPPSAGGGSGGLGLSQEKKLSMAGDLAYDHALERVLLPRLLARLESQMRLGMQKPAYLYLATRVYLMLGRQGPLDAALIQEWMELDWAQSFPGAAGAAEREKLSLHLNALLEQDFETYALDGALVDQARRIFSRLPMSERVYARIRSTATSIAPWKPADSLGPAARPLFALQQGQAVDEASVPGLFTTEGLHRAFLTQLPKALREAQSESWVLGPDAAATAGDAQQLETAVLQLYAQDYISEWSKMLNSVVLLPFGSPSKAAAALNMLGAPNSPLKDLLQGVARQLSPGTAPVAAAPAGGTAASAVLGAVRPPSVNAPAGLGGAATAGMAAATGAATSRVAEAMGVSSQTNPAAVVGKVVEDHFKPLIEAAGKPLDMVLGLLSAMYEQVAKVASTAPGSAPLQAAVGLDASQRLLDEAKIAPEPLSRWLTVAAQSSSSVRAGGTRAAVAAAAAQQLAPFCSGVETRFPFSQDPGAADMPMNDFVRLFGPGGAFEQFFAQNLRDFVDTSKRVWQPVSMAGGQSPISSSDVAQFQRAAVIRNAFFPAALPGQAAASLRFELVPLALDPGARSATLEADGVKTPLAASSMPGRAVALTWPARSAVILSFDGDAQAPPLANDGPWAALRFVARSRLQPTSVPDKLRLTMQSGSRAAEFELRTNSIVHPFGLRELADFRCPRLGP